MYADVIIPLGVESFFTYSVPEEYEHSVTVGALVVVSFVKNKRYTGVVYALHTNPPVGFETKPIERVIEEGFALSGSHLKFLLWLSEYYACSITCFDALGELHEFEFGERLGRTVGR